MDKDKAKPSPESEDSIVEIDRKYSDDGEETELFTEYSSFDYSDDSECTQIENITLTDSADRNQDADVEESPPPQPRKAKNKFLENTFIISREEPISPLKGAGDGEKSQYLEPLQQEESRDFEIKAFRSNFEHYMDNESMDPEDGRPDAIRSVLVLTGNKIGSPCTFLVHLYLSKGDANRNYWSGDINLKQNQTQPVTPLFLEVEVKLVDASQDYIFSNFTVDVSGGELGFICRMDDPIREWSIGTAFSAHHMISDWGSIMKKLAPDESLFIDIRHIVYVDPGQWGVGSGKDISLIRKFMESGEVDWSRRYVYRDILKGCNERRLSGVIECFDKAITVCKLEDTRAGDESNGTIMVDDDGDESVVVIEETGRRVSFQSSRANST